MRRTWIIGRRLLLFCGILFGFFERDQAVDFLHLAEYVATMKNTQSIWCLHGNLQRSDVWEPFRESFLWPLTAVDVFDELAPSMAIWVDRFCSQVARASAGQKQLLIGYSLGGRLAMQALVKAPELWQAAIIVSADPGNYTADEKQKQLDFDKGWGTRFVAEDWEALLTEWSSQSVFCGIANPLKPKEGELDRQRVALVFDRFSKGRQADLTPGLAALNEPPVLYVSGALDTKYVGIGQKLEKNCAVVRHSSVPEAGHRVPWEKPAAWCEAVNSFFEDR